MHLPTCTDCLANFIIRMIMICSLKYELLLLPINFQNKFKKLNEILQSFYFNFRSLFIIYTVFMKTGFFLYDEFVQESKTSHIVNTDVV